MILAVASGLGAELFKYGKVWPTSDYQLALISRDTCG
jgi:hypothetical protein